MGYAKKILIMGEVTKGFGTGAVKGVATVEQIGQRTKCTVDIFNLKDITKGIFAFGITSDSCPVYVERLGLKGKISTAFGLGDIDIKGNLYCVLTYISEENIIPIAWGANNAKKLWETNILDGFKSITRPKMFAGKLEKVEPKNDVYASAPVTPDTDKIKTQQIQVYGQKSNEQPKDFTEEYKSPVPKSIYEKLKNKSNQQSTVLGRASNDETHYKPAGVPKITVAKISKVIDDAILSYEDERISDVGYYPPEVSPRNILKESAAAAEVLTLAKSQKDFYQAFEEVPKELVDEYAINTIKGSFYRPLKEQKADEFLLREDKQTQYEQNSTTKDYQEEEFIAQKQSYQEQEEFEDQEQQNNRPRYISSWGGYNNIKLKDMDNQNEKDESQNLNGKSDTEQNKEQQQTDNQSNYFESVKDQLDKIFEKSPPEDRLNKLMPDTYWVKVELAKNQYYVVGLIGEGPDYIGYGVPGVYSVNPPKELQGYCKWMAVDLEKPYGEGYWMMYQDADNGESINLDLI